MTVPFLDLEAMHHELGDELFAAMSRVVADSAFVGGHHVDAFEAEWAQFCSVRHTIGVANGTDALELALRGLGIGAGDEVLVPTNTFVATAEAVVSAGATPVFVDVDDATLLLDLDDAAQVVGSHTAAVIPVHLFGQMPNMDAVLAFAMRYQLAVIEDAAQAHGATWGGRPAGSFGHAACFSFYPGKNLGALGDAGAITTNDSVLAERIRSLADHGRSPQSKHLHECVGMNSRLDGMQAAVLSVKLRKLAEWTAQRREAAAHFRDVLADTTVDPVTVDERGESAFHLNVVRATARNELATVLQRAGIGSGIHYPVPCHLQPAFVGDTWRPLPIAEVAAEQILSLPMFPGMTRGQIDHVCAAIIDAGWHPACNGWRHSGAVRSA
jgi:dTDP-4-amino-4,6-dideoxygalactose transaminase